MSDIILDNLEGKPETINWRSNRLKLWSTIRQRRDEDFASAARFTSHEAARDYAMKRAAGEVRPFLADVLRRSSATAAAQFVGAAPYGWWDKPEILLDTGELVPRLVNRSYPSASFAEALQELEKERAQIDTEWGPWVRHWMTVVEQETGVQIDAAAEVLQSGADVARTWAAFMGNVIKYGPPILLGSAIVVGVVAFGRRFR